MSARNRPEAKAARRAERQHRSDSLAAPGISKARIAQAVHHAVCEETGIGGFGMCQLYARAGALVAEFATGRPYMWQAGELRIGTGDFNEEGELLFQYLPEASGYNGTEFHCWIVTRPAGLTPGDNVEAQPHDEFIDFGMRHLSRAISMSGFPWKREPLPEFFWGTRPELARLRVVMNTDPVMMTIVQQSDADTRTALRTAMLAVRNLGMQPSRLIDWLQSGAAAERTSA